MKKKKFKYTSELNNEKKTLIEIHTHLQEVS
jgi:hypothetical protein